nr:reverse transcriptase domain-containing protein [Tanacetum cinerariifolium]
MKLNPKKCAFGMREGTFLGYKVDADGLRVCPDKVEAVLDLSFPKCLKDVQKLNGKLASLNRFLSKSAEKSLPFFKTLKKCTKKSDFQWTAKAEVALKEMKQLIAELPMLTAPKEKKELIMYLAAAKEAINAVLMTERDGKQIPIYFVSRALQGPEINYTPMEKLILALVSASKRLKRYFQAHTIVVITDQPVKQLLSNPKVTGRLLKYRFELGENDIQYRPRTSVKGQILSDFIVEHLEDDTPDTSMKDMEELPDPWILFTDGSSCINGFGVGLIITNPEGMEFTYALSRANGSTKSPSECGLKTRSQPGFSIKQIPRGENKKADALSKISYTSFAHLSKQVLVEELREKAIDEKEILVVVEEEGHTWMTPVYKYLTKGILPEEKRKQGLCAAKPRSMVAKALRSGYYWPTMHTDARNLIRECSDCQVHRPVPRNPQEKVTPITSPWLFYKYGIDIAGPFSEGPGKVKFLIVAMDYFTKWIEARPVATITWAQVKKFVWDNIVCRFGLSGEIVSDNGKQFRDNPFKDWCEKLNIRQCFASVKHTQANGLVERANRSLQEGIKARLGDKNKNWVEEILHVLWSHHTMIKSSNGETPFSLTYGAEAVIPAEIGMPTLRTAEVDMVKNNEALGISLDLFEEKKSKLQYRKQGAKPKRKDITTPGSERQAFVQETLSTGKTKQATRKTGESSNLSERDHMKSQKQWTKERTVLEITMDTPFREHGISATLKSAIYMKCKHPLHVEQSGKECTDRILFICNIFKFLMNEN